MYYVLCRKDDRIVSTHPTRKSALIAVNRLGLNYRATPVEGYWPR